MKAVAVFGAVLATAVAINWAVDRLDNQETRVSTGSAEVYPDATFRNVRILTTDKDGKATYRMNASVVRHFTDGTTELEQPVLLIETDDARPWRVHSQQGWTDEKSKQAKLKGEVFLDRAGNEASDSIHVVSKDITIDYATSFAHTDAATKLESGSHKASGTGMDIWFKRPVRVRLLKDVRGQHVF